MASPALAGKAKVALHPVVVVGGGVRPDAAATITQAIVDELRAAELAVVIVEDTSKAPIAKSALAAEQKLGEGRRELARMHVPKAIELIDSAIAGLSADLANVADHARFVDAALLLAEAHYRRGNEAAGRRAFEAVVRWAPETTLDARKYPPIFVGAFDDVRAALVRGPRGSVRVSGFDGARVVFNGRAMGEAPLVIDDVIPGDNHVVVRMGEGDTERRAGAVVAVEASRVAEPVLTLGGGGDGVRDSVASNRFDGALRSRGQALGKSSTADVVVIMAIAHGDPLYTVAGFIGHVKSGRWGALPMLQVDVDMLSASIEAGKLAREIGAQVRAVKGSVTESVPFIAARDPVVAKANPAGAVRHVGFVAPGAVTARKATEEPSASTRGPVPPDRQPRADERLVEARQPVTSEPIVADSGPLTRASHLERDSALAADLAAVDGYDPLVQDLGVQTEVHGSSVTGKWWFWAAVGVGAAIVGGTTYYLLSRDNGGNTLSVQAAW